MSLSFRVKILVCLCLAALFPAMAHAQFNTSSNDDALLKWYSIQSNSFKVIYPKGNDSLARLYLRELEKWRPEVARSVGMMANGFNRKPLPVVLHTQNAASNGSVTWTPRRMELNTVPDWSNPTPTPWHTSLAIHEGRHAAQLQLGYQKVFNPFYYILGEMVPGAACAYPGRMLLEGDAVVAETALTDNGRGRSSDFLGTYMYFWDKGSRRSYISWRCGSYYRETPDVYAFGYALISGARTLYDKPLFMQDYFDYVSRRPYDPWPLRHTLRRNSGKKFGAAYNEIMDYQYALWAADTLSRGPFMPSTQISRPTKALTGYCNAIAGAEDDKVFWLKTEMYHIPSLVSMDINSGKEKRLTFLPYSVSNVDYVPTTNSLVWNELRHDPRWGQKIHSVVCSYDMNRKRHSRITPRDHNYYFPTYVCGDTIAVVHYGEDTHEHIDFMRMSDRKVLDTWQLPDSLQTVEMTYAGGRMYTVGMSEHGTGVYTVTPSSCTQVLPPIPFAIGCVDAVGDHYMTFHCDRTGSNEYYVMDVNSAKVYRLSNTKYGGDEFCILSNGDLVFSHISDYGEVVALTESEFLDLEEVDWNKYYHYAVADKLSQQEKLLRERADSAAVADGEAPLDSLQKAGVEMSEPKRYWKMGHMARIHSWAPAYIDVDAVQDLSFENITKVASLGAMAFFQNDMSTFSGYVGYKAKPDASKKWFHSGHVNLTYKGLYPVFEAEFHVNERNETNTEWIKTAQFEDALKRSSLDYPYIRGHLRTYIPLNWNIRSHYIGFVPSASVSLSNDLYKDKPYLSWYADLRAYAMQSTPSAAIYPRWGIGGQIRYTSAHYDAGMSRSAPLLLANIYGYVPGIGWGQGLRLSALYQKDLRGEKIFNPGGASLLPRGFENVTVVEGLKVSADYAAPFPVGDWHISDAFLCTRGIATPHFDYSWIPVSGGSGSLMSAGLDLELEFGAFLWVKVPMTFGIRYDYNFGSLYNQVASVSKRHYVGFLFNIDIP